jgi:hypothetical protein
MNKFSEFKTVIKRFFTDKRFIYGSGSVATIVGFIAIAVLVNVIIGLLSDKFILKADLTENKIFKLSQQTVDVVKEISENVDVILFERTGNEDPKIRELLQRYINLNSNLKLKVYDPDKDPMSAQKYKKLGQTISAGSIVFDNGRNYMVVSPSDLQTYNPVSGAYDNFNAENKLTSAIISLSKRADMKVAFTQGHGEKTIYTAEQLIKDDNIAVEKVSTLTQGFPEEYDMFLVISPQMDFTAEEIEALDAYLKKGKSIQVYLDFKIPSLPRLESYLSDMGIQVQDNVVFESDAKRIAYNTPLCFIPVIKSHPITSAIISNNLNVIVYGNRVVSRLWEEKNSVKVETLLESSDKSIVTDSEGNNVKGPFSLAVVATRFDSENKEAGKLFVMGSSEFLNEQFSTMNKDFILGSINWQIDDTEALNIRPKSLSSSKLEMTRQDIVIWAIASIVFIPVIVLVFGLITWLRRRHL